jgi:hypothetical protein
MKFRTTFILLAIAMALGSFILVLDRQTATTRERDSRRQRRILVVQRNEIKGFTIHNGDEEVKVKSNGDTWQLTKPWLDDADGGLVDKILNAIQTLRPDDVIENLGKRDSKRDKIKEFGLHRAKLSLKLDGKHAPPEIEFGGDAAVPGKCYLRIQDQDVVYVVSDDLKNLVARKPENFRDHRITPFLTTLISRIVLRMNGGEIDLEKQQDNWQLTRPIKARADNDTVVNLLNKINQTQIARFVSNTKTSLTGANSDSSPNIVTLFAGNDDKVEIQLGTVDPSDNQMIFAFLPGREAVVQINKSFADWLDLTPNDLRDRSLARLNADLVDRVTIEQSGRPRIVIGRDEQRWRFIAPQSASADSNSVNRLFDSINSSEIKTFIADTATDLARYGLDRPILKLIFSSYASENTAESNAGETPIMTLEFGKSEEGSTYGRIVEEPFIFSVSNELLASLPVDEFDLKSLSITDLNRTDLISVHIERPNRGPLDLFRNDQNKWTLKDVGNEQNDGEVQLLLNAIVALRAVKWVGDAKPEYGLEAPLLTLVIGYRNSDKKEVITFKFGSADADHLRFANVSTLRGVFKINETIFNQLNANLVQ